MTQKALNFVVNGMLTTEREITEKRIAHMFIKLADRFGGIVVDQFTDGFVTDAVVLDENSVLEFVRARNEKKHLERITNWKFTYEDTFRPKLVVTCERTAYFPVNGRTWDSANEPDDEHTECRVVDYSENIYLYPDSVIPGVQLYIL